MLVSDKMHFYLTFRHISAKIKLCEKINRNFSILFEIFSQSVFYFRKNLSFVFPHSLLSFAFCVSFSPYNQPAFLVFFIVFCVIYFSDFGVKRLLTGFLLAICTMTSQFCSDVQAYEKSEIFLCFLSIFFPVFCMP